MKHSVQKLLSVCLVFVLVLAMGIPIHAATPYSVKVANSAVYFLQNGKVTGTYATSDSNITLMVDNTGALLVCFNNGQNRYIGVTLGSQRDLSISGTVNVLTLDKSYTGPLNSTALTTRLKVNGNSNVVQRNGVGLLEMTAGGTVSVEAGAIINQATLTSSDARLTVQSGGKVTEAKAASKNSVVCIGPSLDGKLPGGVVGAFFVQGNQGSGSNSSSSSNSNSNSSSELRFSTKSIYADEGDSLRDLESDLYDAVKVYNKENKRVYGEFEWTSSGSTTVRKSGTYRFKFIPDSTRYKTTQDSLRIVVDEDSRSYDYYLEVDDIDVSRDDYTLGDLKSKLRNAVTAYDSDTDRKISGTVEWEDRSSTRVEESGSYDFTFKPSSSRYDNESDSVYIYVK